MENRWIHAFHKSISVRWNANSLDQAFELAANFVYIHIYIYIYIYIYMCVCVCVCVYPTPPHQHDTWSVFKRSLTDSNFEFSFSYTCCHTNVKEPSLHSWKENSWNHTFPKVINTTWNLSSLIQDSNSRCPVHFLWSNHYTTNSPIICMFVSIDVRARVSPSLSVCVCAFVRVYYFLSIGFLFIVDIVKSQNQMAPTIWRKWVNKKTKDANSNNRVVMESWLEHRER